jgi:hypothetical protein
VELDYPNGELVHIDWQSSGAFSSGWGNGGSTRGSYYGYSAAPTVLFDGGDMQVGAGDSVSAYNTYSPIVATNQAQVSHAKVIIDAQVDFNSDTLLGTATLTVTVAPGESVGNPGNNSLRMAVLENNLNGYCCEPRTGNTSWNYIGRTMVIDTPCTFDGTSGSSQTVVQGFAIDPSWNVDNLEAIAWFQRDTNKVVDQAGKALLQYAVSVAALDPVVGKTTGADQTYDVEVTYDGGTPDDVVLTLDTSALPGGWSTQLAWGATTDPATITIPAMTNGQTETVTVTVTPAAARAVAGLGTVTLTTAPATNSTVAVSQDYHTFLNTPAILFVDDDNAAAFEVEFQNAIAGAGHFAVTTPDGAAAATMLLYDAIVWNTGEFQNRTLGAAAQTGLRGFLDAGGRLFMASHGLLNHQGLVTLVTDYLGVSAFTQDGLAASATGVASDPIGDGLSFTLSPPFADGADHLTPSLATTWLEAPGNESIGVRYDSGTFKTVFLAAPFEGIPPSDQTTVMTRVLDWLVGGGAPVAAEDVATTLAAETVLRQNVPNPFRSVTSVKFALPAAADVQLEVFDVAGRRVTRLVSGQVAAGEHTVTWDGRNAAGRRAAAGVYLVRLHTPERTLTRDVVLLR